MNLESEHLAFFATAKLDTLEFHGIFHASVVKAARRSSPTESLRHI